jgi:hypothetical protein
MVRRLPSALRTSALSISVLCAVSVSLVTACGGGDSVSATIKDNTPASGSAAKVTGTPNDASAAPSLTMPVSRFALSLDDLGAAFITNVPDTYLLDIESYGKTRIFPTPEEGKTMLKQWGYQGGYETSFRPEGGDVAVLNGAYYIYVETHLFGSADNAKKAFDYFDAKLKASGATLVEAAQLGNQSSAVKAPGGKIRNSSVDSVDHRLMFRRGNLVVIVRTLGADPFMKTDTVRELAQTMDQKALGKTPATEPTPTSNFTPASGPKAVPTATATAKK